MPSKSKRTKGKRYQQIKKTQNTAAGNAVPSSTPAVKVSPRQAAPAGSVLSAKLTAAEAARANLYAYIPGDLKRVGTLTAVIIVVLIALYYILI